MGLPAIGDGRHGPGMSTTFVALLKKERDRLRHRLEELERELDRIERASAAKAGAVATSAEAMSVPAGRTVH